MNPWLSIWVKPRLTIQRIIDTNPKFRFFILSFLYGLPTLFHTAQNLSLGTTISTTGIVIASIVLAGFVGMLGIFISTVLISWTGKWIGGTGNFQSIRAAVSWANAPNIVTILVWCLLIWSFHHKIFVLGYDRELVGNRLVLDIITKLVIAVVAVWSFIILVKGIGQAQGFSAWKGVLNVMIPFFLVGIVVFFISWLISLTGHGMGA